MKEKWFKYLSEQSDELIPIMEEYFNDKISFDEMNLKVSKINNDFNYLKFKKEIILGDILDS